LSTRINDNNASIHPHISSGNTTKQSNSTCKTKVVSFNQQHFIPSQTSLVLPIYHYWSTQYDSTTLTTSSLIQYMQDIPVCTIDIKLFHTMLGHINYGTCIPQLSITVLNLTVHWTVAFNLPLLALQSRMVALNVNFLFYTAIWVAFFKKPNFLTIFALNYGLRLLVTLPILFIVSVPPSSQCLLFKLLWYNPSLFLPSLHFWRDKYHQT
jgi:hypothetical protein